MSENEKLNGSINTNLSKSGITKPSIELDDFFAYLDPKVVEKIKQTSEAEKSRISNDINNYEYELIGIQNIIDSLKG